MLFQKVRVYIEIEKGSNIKYEFDKDKNKLLIDRILPDPFIYPYAYGFIPSTLAMDGDDLDILVITDKNLKKDEYYDAFIVGVLVMEDEKGMDEKVICILEEDTKKIQDIADLDNYVLDEIHYFFSNYKKNTYGKWSRVIGYKNKDFAIKLYENSMVQ